MGAAIALRGDCDDPGLRRLAKETKDAGESRRLLVLAEIYDGGAFSNHTTISLPCAATHGTTSSISRGKLSPSGGLNGPIGYG